MKKCGLGALILVIATTGAMAQQSGAAPKAAPTVQRYEFLLTGNRAISLRFPNVTIAIGSKFSESDIRRALPGYTLEQWEDEGRPVWSAFPMKDAQGQGIGGIDIYASNDGKTVRTIVGLAGASNQAIDGSGASSAMALTEVFKSGTANCAADFNGLNGPSFWCDAPGFPDIHYLVDVEKCAASVALGTYRRNVPANPFKTASTKVDACMKIANVFIGERFL